MDELRESSLLFSIEGLLETERERVQREAREAERRREDELKRVADAAERRRIALEREHEARARRVVLEQERQKLEEERLEAMRSATVERARIEAEARVRLVEADEQRKHELLLSKLHGETRLARYKALAFVSSGALLVALAAALSAYLGWVRPARAQDARRYEALQAETRVQKQADQQALHLERARSQALRDRVRELEARAPAAVASSPSPVKVQPLHSPTPVVPGKTPKLPCRDSGDPLDDCLIRR